MCPAMVRSRRAPGTPPTHPGPEPPDRVRGRRAGLPGRRGAHHQLWRAGDRAAQRTVPRSRPADRPAAGRPGHRAAGTGRLRLRGRGSPVGPGDRPDGPGRPGQLPRRAPRPGRQPGPQAGDADLQHRAGRADAQFLPRLRGAVELRDGRPLVRGRRAGRASPQPCPAGRAHPVRGASRRGRRRAPRLRAGHDRGARPAPSCFRRTRTWPTWCSPWPTAPRATR